MIIGHQKNLKMFSKMIEEEKFPHAVLFVGPEKIGKRTIALKIAQYLESEHKEFKNFFEFSQRECSCNVCKLIEEGKFSEITDIKEEENEENITNRSLPKASKQIPIKKIREIQRQISLSSSYPFKIIIIDHAENLSDEAVGALLKVLEEPRGRTIFFLITSMPYRLPRTILSRVQIFKFYTLNKKEIEKFLTDFLKREEINEEYIDFSLGKPGLAKELILDKKRILYYNNILEDIKNLAKLPEFQRFKKAEILVKNDKIEEFLFLSEIWFRDLLLKKENILSAHLSFSSKEKEIQIESQKFSEKKLKEIIILIEKTKNYLNFSNTNQLLALENLLLKI